jgi:hypothetical protein
MRPYDGGASGEPEAVRNGCRKTILCPGDEVLRKDSDGGWRLARDANLLTADASAWRSICYRACSGFSGVFMTVMNGSPRSAM